MRKLQQRIADETAKEKRLSGDKGVAMLRAWVPSWIGHHYQNEKSRKRAFNAWAHLSAYFKMQRVHHPEEVGRRLENCSVASERI